MNIRQSIWEKEAINHALHNIILHQLFLQFSSPDKYLKDMSKTLQLNQVLQIHLFSWNTSTTYKQTQKYFEFLQMLIHNRRLTAALAVQKILSQNGERSWQCIK